MQDSTYDWTKLGEQVIFPHLDLTSLGYPYQVFSGEKSYNGVSIASKIPLQNTLSIDFGATGQKRHISAALPDGTRVHCLYVPAGGDIPDPRINHKFAQKLDVLHHLAKWSASLDATEKHLLVGDLNIAPLEQDVWSHKALLNVVSHTPLEVEKLSTIQRAHGWVDAIRHFVPESEKCYSWWSYRAADWHKSDRGRRLDHIWISPPLLPYLKSFSILKDARGWRQPSDHVPVSATFIF